jgi:hypothetical protein
MSLLPTQRDKLRSAERAAESFGSLAEALGKHAAALEAENADLKARVLELEGRINTPHTDEWFEAVRLEAAHQVERWGTKHDEGKEPTDWLWLIGYLVGKACASAVKGDVKKAKHHTVSSAAVLLNWFRNLTGDNAEMRPGIAGADSKTV